ncbi:MAG: hypothetical protein WCE32_06750, partial [Pseudolabrys sp.]
MPRYYFHLTDGKQLLNNHKGIDLPGNAAAREDAVGTGTRPQTWRGHAGLELAWLVRCHRRRARTQ